MLTEQCTNTDKYGDAWKLVSKLMLTYDLRNCQLHVTSQAKLFDSFPLKFHSKFQMKFLTMKEAFHGVNERMQEAQSNVLTLMEQPEPTVPRKLPSRVSIENADLFLSKNNEMFELAGVNKANHWKAALEKISEVSDVECKEIFDGNKLMPDPWLNRFLGELKRMKLPEAYLMVRDSNSKENCIKYHASVVFALNRSRAVLTVLFISRKLKEYERKMNQAYNALSFDFTSTTSE